jgi:hypothetical protein
MPRFTIGSLATGVTLFVLVVALWETFGRRQAQAQRVAHTVSPDGRHVAGAVDPATGRVVLDGPNDLELSDTFPWDGGLSASTW